MMYFSLSQKERFSASNFTSDRTRGREMKILIVSAALLTLAGCGIAEKNYQSWKREQDEKWAQMDRDREALDQQVKAEIAASLAANEKECDRKGRPAIGMTKDQVRASCWGKPQYANRTVTAHGESEQWVYARGYIYFRNGKVEAIHH
jgi:hypothetical protein